MNVILLHSNHRHVSTAHVATFMAARTRIKYTISNKDRRMHTYIINTTLLTLYNSDVFQPSKSYRQGVRQVHFSSKVNKMIYQM